MQHFKFDTKEEFLVKLEELVKSGVPKDNIETYTPYPVHETEHLVDDKPSPVRFFTAIGAVTGLFTGFAFTLYTVFDWPSPMITGGKPLASIPAFMVIAYELTILFGVLATFVGFLHFAKVPVIASIFKREDEMRLKFEIEVHDRPRERG